MLSLCYFVRFSLIADVTGAVGIAPEANIEAQPPKSLQVKFR